VGVRIRCGLGWWEGSYAKASKGVFANQQFPLLPVDIKFSLRGLTKIFLNVFPVR
jgi:hypothetical protein